MTSILDQVNAYYIKTQERIDFLGKEMQDAPCGSLRIRTRSGNKAYYVRSYEQGKLSERYIPPTDKNTITALARKRYARYVLPYLKQNLRAAHQFIKMYSGQEEDLLAVKMPADILGASGGIYVTAAQMAVPVMDGIPGLRRAPSIPDAARRLCPVKIRGIHCGCALQT